MSLLVLSGQDVDQIVSRFRTHELTDLMANIFVDLAASSKAEGDNSRSVVIPHRSTISSQNHHTLFMPSRLAPLAGTAIKIVSVPTTQAPREIKERGLPASTLVLDEHTGEVSAFVNARKLTALRNAASQSLFETIRESHSTNVGPVGSLLATRLLGPEAPQSIVAIGAGAQIAAHLSLFLSHYRSIQTCTIFNRSANQRLRDLISELSQKFRGRVSIHGHLLARAEDGQEHPELRRLISETQIVITATSSTESLFSSRYVSPGTHLCLIGSYTPAM